MEPAAPTLTPFSVHRHTTTPPWEGEWDVVAEYALPDVAAVWAALAADRASGLAEGDLVCVFSEGEAALHFGYVRGRVRPLPTFAARGPLVGLAAAWLDQQWGLGASDWAGAWQNCTGATWLFRVASYTGLPVRRLAAALISLVERAWPEPELAELREALAAATAWRDGDPAGADRAAAAYQGLRARGIARALGNGFDEDPGTPARNAVYTLGQLPRAVDGGLTEWWGKLDDTLDFADAAVARREQPGAAADWLRATHLPLRVLLDVLTEEETT